jgi:hypothetical protein
MSTYTTSIWPVQDGRRCIGFVMKRGRTGFQAYDDGEKSLGLFPTAQDGVDAVLEAAHPETGQGRPETERGRSETGQGHSETAERSP